MFECVCVRYGGSAQARVSVLVSGVDASERVAWSEYFSACVEP